MAKKTLQPKYYEGIGRRKSSTARVRLYVLAKESELSLSEAKIKKGEIFVNTKNITTFFPSEIEKKRYTLPLSLTENEKRFAISVHIRGGGKSSQLDALILGLARALEISDKTYRQFLKKTDSLAETLVSKNDEKSEPVVKRGDKSRVQNVNLFNEVPSNCP